MLGKLPLCMFLPAVAFGGSGATEDDAMVNYLRWDNQLKMKLETWNSASQVGQEEYEWTLHGKLEARFDQASAGENYEIGFCTVIDQDEENYDCFAGTLVNSNSDQFTLQDQYCFKANGCQINQS